MVACFTVLVNNRVWWIYNTLGELHWCLKSEVRVLHVFYQ